jgi:hypothetical protein
MYPLIILTLVFGIHPNFILDYLEEGIKCLKFNFLDISYAF